MLDPHVHYPCVVLSAEREGLSLTENLRRTEDLACAIEALGLPFRRGLGRSNGRAEECFVVSLSGRNQHELRALRYLGLQFQQDWLLYLAPRTLFTDTRPAWLVSPDGADLRELPPLRLLGPDEPRPAYYTQVGDRVYSCTPLPGVVA